MRKLPDKYIPFFCLLLMFLFCWVEELVVENSEWNIYAKKSIIIRAFFRIDSVIIFFILGITGLTTFPYRWIRNLWIGLYAAVVLAGGIRLFPLIFFHRELPLSIHLILSAFYGAVLTPFPFMLLWLLAVIVKRNQFSEKVNTCFLQASITP